MRKPGSRRSLGPRHRTPAAAKYLGIAASTLEKMRCAGSGPDFERVGKRTVVYSEESLERYLEQTRARSTSEAGNLPAGPGRRKRRRALSANPNANDTEPADRQSPNAGTRNRSDEDRS